MGSWKMRKVGERERWCQFVVPLWCHELHRLLCLPTRKGCKGNGLDLTESSPEKGWRRRFHSVPGHH